MMALNPSHSSSGKFCEHGPPSIGQAVPVLNELSTPSSALDGWKKDASQIMGSMANFHRNVSSYKSHTA
jgi:hypothetical protein